MSIRATSSESGCLRLGVAQSSQAALIAQTMQVGRFRMFQEHEIPSIDSQIDEIEPSSNDSNGIRSLSPPYLSYAFPCTEVLPRSRLVRSYPFYIHDVGL